ncbi:hypothetical protein AAFF_G00413040 [Aldrovandia affinis]|uniref:Uncharacterized protein n=1 Tax=Aldrovandia affinis TaxID=143900 RepID=A0AAD7WJF5_9TELE|nr:hypothetical protein AAFF_G00413040 [Aldrovandia affinis]
MPRTCQLEHRTHHLSGPVTGKASDQQFRAVTKATSCLARPHGQKQNGPGAGFDPRARRGPSRCSKRPQLASPRQRAGAAAATPRDPAPEGGSEEISGSCGE